MDFQFKSDSNDTDAPSENEYHLEIKIEKLVLNKIPANQVQMIFIFGDLVNKITLTEGEESFDGLQQEYIIHSIPSSLAEKLQKLPMMIYLLSLVDSKPLGSMLLEVNECFANAVKCADFREESIKKMYELKNGKEDLGSLSFVFKVIKDIGNSNRHRHFYTESTLEKIKMQND